MPDILLFKICNFSVMKKCNVIFLFLIIFINLDFNLIEAKETPQEQFERGLCYLRGDGVDKDLEKAVAQISSHFEKQLSSHSGDSAAFLHSIF